MGFVVEVVWWDYFGEVVGFDKDGFVVCDFGVDFVYGGFVVGGVVYFVGYGCGIFWV